MYPSTTTMTSNHSYSNGHLSPPTKAVINGATTPDSESDLSEAMDIPVAPTSFSAGEQDDAGEDSRMQESDVESSQDEDALGSDDPDYNMATSPPGDNAFSRDPRSSSQDSPRQRKRKAGTGPDNYMLDDPELYGLRRSVGQLVSRSTDIR